MMHDPIYTKRLEAMVSEIVTRQQMGKTIVQELLALNQHVGVLIYEQTAHETEKSLSTHFSERLP